MALHPFALESINISIEIRSVILGEATIGDVVVALIKGVAIGILADGLCGTVLGMVLKPIMAVFGLGSQVEQIQVAIENGDPAEISVRVTQLLCMLFGLTSQCFTGDTLVATEDGLKPIEDVKVGEFVWSEDTETGEKELRKVLAVSVTETAELVHVWIGEEEIKTTRNHPFYVEGEGWKAVGELVAGDVLRTESGNLASVRGVSVERLEEPVRVWNLEIESAHVYYVGSAGVLVHNECIKEYDVAPYGEFKNYPGDNLTGHELLQNAWLEANGYGIRGGSYSRQNPAIALFEDPIHKMISSLQRTNKMNTRNLAGMSWRENVLKNIEFMIEANVPRGKIAELAWASRKFALDNGF